jgi:RHS repeat-associated protein
LQPVQIALGNVPQATNLLKLGYDYGTTQNNGNVLSQTITVPTVGQTPGFVATQSYSYDSLNRLKQAAEMITPDGGTPAQSWKQTFTFDRYGNRNFDESQTTTLVKNCGTPPNETVCPADVPVVNPSVNTANNRLNGYLYDAAGNAVRDAENRRFTYDGENKQVKVEILDANGNPVATIGEYFYDGDGKRVKKFVPSTGETTIFVYDASGKMLTEYSTIVEPPSTAKVSYLTTDHLGSPRILTDTNGNVISRRDFHPFGEEIITAQRTQGLGYTADSVRQKFTGYERDHEIDFDFAQARYYNPSHGRFTAADPLLASGKPGNPQTWNRYIYVGNNPLIITDPTGLKWYYNSALDRYKWFEDNAKVEDGFVAVVGTRGNDERGVGSFVYQTENGWVRLNPYANQFETFDNRGDAIKNFGDIYQCNCQELVNTIAEQSVRKGTTAGIIAGVAVVVGTGAGVAMAATGTAVGGSVIVLGLTETGTATTAATATTAVTTAASTSIQTSSTIGRALTGFTKHGINSAISHDGVGVSVRAILNTLQNPVKVIAQSEGRLKVVGKEAVVVLNRAGKVITAWARNNGATRVTP